MNFHILKLRQSLKKIIKTRLPHNFMLKGTSLTSLDSLTINAFTRLLNRSKHLNKTEFTLPPSGIQELLGLHVEGYLPKHFVLFSIIVGCFEDQEHGRQIVRNNI